MATGSGLKFAVKVDTDAALKAFRASRRDLGKVVKATLEDVGRTHALPLAKANAPRILRNDITIKATTRDAFFTNAPSVRGWRRGRFWYLNNGGMIRKPFTAKPGRPIPILNGGGLVGFRMSVKNPRRYRGKRFLEKTAFQVRPRVRDELARRIPEAIQQHLDQADVFRGAA